MPIYEYRCDSCGCQRELFVKSGQVSRPSCTACRKRMRRVISPTSFILKGAGWYVTDYPSDERRKAMEGEKPPAPAPTPEAAGAKKDLSSTDKKPAAPSPGPTSRGKVGKGGRNSKKQP